MPQPTKVDLSPLYLAMEEEGKRLKDGNNCAVIALAIAADVPYDYAMKCLKHVGRRPDQGVYIATMREALKLLGYKMIGVKPEDFIRDNYPERSVRMIKQVTTHHPDRYKKAWAGKPPIILDTGDHLSAVRDGILHDWTRSKKLKIQRIYLVEKKGAET